MHLFAGQVNRELYLKSHQKRKDKFKRYNIEKFHTSSKIAQCIYKRLEWNIWAIHKGSVIALRQTELPRWLNCCKSLFFSDLASTILTVWDAAFFARSNWFFFCQSTVGGNESNICDDGCSALWVLQLSSFDSLIRVACACHAIFFPFPRVDISSSPQYVWHFRCFEWQTDNLVSFQNAEVRLIFESI